MSTTDTTTPPAAAEEKEAGPVAGFEDLAADAEALEGGPAPDPAKAAAAAAADLEQTARDLMQTLHMARMLAAPAFRWWGEFGDVWGDNTLRGVSMHGAAIMQRHGWDFAEVMGKWGPYIGLAVCLAPPCLVTHQAIKARSAELERAARATRPDNTQDTGNDGNGQAPH